MTCALASEKGEGCISARPHHCCSWGSHLPYMTLILKKMRWQVDAPTFSHTVELTFWFSEAVMSHDGPCAHAKA